MDIMAVLIDFFRQVKNDVEKVSLEMDIWKYCRKKKNKKVELVTD